MPEADSDEKTLGISRAVAEALGIEALHQDITRSWTPRAATAQRNEAVRELIPELTDEWRWKIVLPSVVGTDSYRLYALVAEAPDGRTVEVRLPAKNYLTIVAATNFKQRVRKMIEYYHADRLNYAVVGTPNRVEYDQGFFVKGGDGAADVKPIAHLYKTQVYQLAEHLGLPRRSWICSPRRTPTRSHRPRRSSTSRCRTSSSTSACTPTITPCRRKPSRPQSG